MIDNLDVRVVVFSLRSEQLQVLLRPGATVWELPGCPVLVDQSLDEAASRSVQRLTGQRDPYLEQLYTYGDAARSGPCGRLISVVYFAILPARALNATATAPALSKDEEPAQWFPADHLPALAADHGEVISYALRRMRYKLEYTAIGFQLLPEVFSLSELQNVYEMILGERLDKRNFRRRILQARIIEETSTLRAGEGRPARLYRYRADAVAEVKARRLFP